MGEERCFNPHFVEFKQVSEGKNGTRPFPRSKTEAVAATAVRLTELGPVMIFAGQARWVPSMVKAVLLAFDSNALPHPWPETEWKVFEAVCKEELGEDSLELKAARAGIICHSNKLPPQVRILIEKLISKYPPRVIVATTTLGQGVNIGISSVIVATTSIGQEQISKRDFWNICGRAGRAFVDSEGKVLFAIDMTGKAWQVKKAEQAAKNYFNITHLEKVESGLLQLVRILHTIAGKSGITFETLLELVANDAFDRCGKEKANVEDLVDWIDDQLLALHVAYKGDDETVNIDWVDDAFRDSLAAIQEKARREQGHDDQLLEFLRARATGVLRKVQSPEARRAIIASGLPLSVGLLAFNQLDVFREMVDHYLGADANGKRLEHLVLNFETWARQNAKNMVVRMPDQHRLDQIRPLWLIGDSLSKIIEVCGSDCVKVCTELYGYQLPWLFHSIAQKLDKSTEKNRIDVLAMVGLLVELGLPTEAAAKVFLAGVRSREAALELSHFITNSEASVSTIRQYLLDADTVSALSSLVSASTIEWLKLLYSEHNSESPSSPQCPKFRLKVPNETRTLHVRQLATDGPLYLCSIDARFKVEVEATKELPFNKFANDPRYAFVRDGSVWLLQCRDPRIRLN